MPVFLAEGQPPSSDLAGNSGNFVHCLDASTIKGLKGLKSKVLNSLFGG